jgi:hypothetical protein
MCDRAPARAASRARRSPARKNHHRIAKDPRIRPSRAYDIADQHLRTLFGAGLPTPDVCLTVFGAGLLTPTSLFGAGLPTPPSLFGAGLLTPTSLFGAGLPTPPSA